MVREVVRGTAGSSAARITVDLGRHSRGLGDGQSVALNGVCLTVTGISKTACTFDVIAETMKRTSLGGLAEGDAVNIERSLRASGRLEGHFVLGHVDGVGRIRRISRDPGEVRVGIALPRGLARYVVPKGSIAADGISLTVTGIRGATASVSLIPHTLKTTNFGGKREGDPVNIETDILGKYALAGRR